MSVIPCSTKISPKGLQYLRKVKRALNVGNVAELALSTQFCIMAVGCLSAANRPAFDGLDDFKGPVYHTGEWPHEGVDLTGKRVAVIGTGSSAIQSIPIIAKQASSLTVFQRTANYTVPAWNAKLDDDYVAAIKADYPGLRAKARARSTSFSLPCTTKPALSRTPA